MLIFVCISRLLHSLKKTFNHENYIIELLVSLIIKNFILILIKYVFLSEFVVVYT